MSGPLSRNEVSFFARVEQRVRELQAATPCVRCLAAGVVIRNGQWVTCDACEGSRRAMRWAA